MAKSFKTAAAAPNFMDLITQGLQDTPDVQGVRTVQDTPATKSTPAVQRERLSLRLPVDVKEYLQEAAYRESTPAHSVSITEYLVKLVREDKAKHQHKK